MSRVLVLVVLYVSGREGRGWGWEGAGDCGGLGHVEPRVYDRRWRRRSTGAGAEARGACAHAGGARGGRGGGRVHTAALAM